jgi:UDP-N-acetylmuramoylalanine--D-glutamate ligase
MNLVVLGAGESGVGAAILGKQKKYNVFVSDIGSITEKYKNVLLNNEISFEERKHSKSIIFEGDIVVKSPGIPDTAIIIKEIKEREIPIISEIEFA